MSSTRSVVLRVYKRILRESGKFTNYNYREYALRRTRDGFREHSGELNALKIDSLLHEAEENLIVIQRQVVISQMYAGPKLVIEDWQPDKELPQDKPPEKKEAT